MPPYELGPLEHDTEMGYHRRQARRQAMDSRAEEAQQLPPEHQVAREERRLKAMPMRTDVCPAGMEGSLYPNWKPKEDTKPKGADQARPYRRPKEEARKKLTLEEELNAKSVF